MRNRARNNKSERNTRSQNNDAPARNLGDIRYIPPPLPAVRQWQSNNSFRNFWSQEGREQIESSRVHYRTDSRQHPRVRESTPIENHPLFSLERESGVSPKSLNRRECTPRKKRMQAIFYVGDQNFALNDAFGKSDSF